MAETIDETASPRKIANLAMIWHFTARYKGHVAGALLALLTAVGFAPAARVKLVLAEKGVFSKDENSGSRVVIHEDPDGTEYGLLVGFYPRASSR
mgnify:CR=1 FL=1